MAFTLNNYTVPCLVSLQQNGSLSPQLHQSYIVPGTDMPRLPVIRCLTNPNNSKTLRTCKNCKTQFDPSLNHPRACRFHTAHFGGTLYSIACAFLFLRIFIVFMLSFVDIFILLGFIHEVLTI